MSVEKIIFASVFGFMLFFLIFVNETYHSIECNTEKCTVSVKKGYFSTKYEPKYSIAHKEIKRAYIKEKNHRDSSRRKRRYSSRRYHTDYIPIVEYNNGVKLELPFKKCRNREDVDVIIHGILSKQNFKYPNK